MSKEYPCVYYDNEKCKFFSGEGVTSYCVLGPCSHETPSNADHIRAMSDEELEPMILAFKLGYAPWCDHHCENEGDDGCDTCILKWLKQPAGGADHEKT